jgi:hypothetical protein
MSMQTLTVQAVEAFVAGLWHALLPVDKDVVSSGTHSASGQG